MADNKSVAQRSVSSVDAIKKMEKELYREALMRDYDLKRGSKYPPMSIEPFPYERQRLSGNYTDADRALRKQWLQDQILTDREPVHVERWMRRNIFRRIWNAPFDALDRALTRTGLPLSATYGIRFALPKLVAGLAAIYALCLHLKVAPRTWETGVGMVVTQANAVTRMSVPGTAEWERFQNGEFYRSKESFDDLGFSKRSAMRDETLLTSAAGPQMNGTVNQ
uniref:NADH dehydrogenase [ubiquinone] 1 beta subcomplex subunit 6 n=2 Tax=Macrostomum lignano TaxID=282301 RepID=A0A1I8GVZ3_9PLAT